MEANRNKIKVRIIAGVGNDIDKYSLAMAEVDLNDLKQAASVPDAVSTITGQANTDNKSAQQLLQTLRTGTFSLTDPSKRLRAWRLGSNGAVDPAKMALLQNWMVNDKTDPNLAQLPPEMLIDLDTPAMEAARKRAIAALQVP
jgi:hypothetical protein